MPAEPFYHTTAWKKVRALALMRDHGMCVDCMKEFGAGYGKKPSRATTVHHIIPYKERPDLALCLDNLVSLCDACHNKRHPEKAQGEKKVTPAKMRVIKI